ncbi:hypothetical protein [Sphingobacterium multivorum]|uniref:hypothetical protein n=1 Tax=Sphingobacterium multivorum TaxID=28454 RepID=UPI003DA1E0B6
MTEPIRYSRKIVAFIDILGFKQIVEQSESDRSKLELIYNALEFLKGREQNGEWNSRYIVIEEDAQKKDLTAFEIAEKTHCTCFSDSIVISVDCEDDSKLNESLSTMIANIATIGARFITEGILLRGAISIGNLIHSSNGLIVGPALVDAYQLESTVAKTPRIILSPYLLSLLNYPLQSKKDRYPYHQYLHEFEDGYTGMHQMILYQVLQSWIEMDKKVLKEDLKKIKSTITAGLKQTASTSINLKYKWLEEQYKNLIIFTDYKEPINQ